MDLAVSAESAKRKGVETPVAGAADILLFPSIEAANITAKTVQYMAGATWDTWLLGRQRLSLSLPGPRACRPKPTPWPLGG